VLVMYAGRMAELAPVEDLFERPRHPYTRALLACHPDRSDALTGIPGLVPSPLAPPPGCRFAPRCSLATEVCSRRPARLVTDAPGHLVGCRLADERQRVGA
jgi:oligopeptide/dipeptide ABC transporter ATP-binding protein